MPRAAAVPTGAAGAHRQRVRCTPFARALNWGLERPAVHRRFREPPKDTLKAFHPFLAFDYDPHPWDDLFQAIAVDHQFDDAFWQQRNILARVGAIRIPLYLGADWDNVGMHLQTPFTVQERLGPDTPWRMGMVPRGGLQWPWESMHVEALARYDHWLKGRDTGITDGPPIRYYVGGAADGEWRTADRWPLPETRWCDLWLDASGRLAAQPPADGSRQYLTLAPGITRGRNTNPPLLPSRLAWDTAPLGQPLEVIGPLVLHLEAASTAPDTDWIVKLCDVAPNGTARDLTQGWLRAGHRAVDPARSRPERPFHPHDRAQPLTSGEPTSFAIALLPTAHRLERGHWLRLLLTSNDTQAGFAMQGLSHTPLGLSARNTVLSRSRLTVPVVRGAF